MGVFHRPPATRPHRQRLSPRGGGSPAGGPPQPPAVGDQRPLRPRRPQEQRRRDPLRPPHPRRQPLAHVRHLRLHLLRPPGQHLDLAPRLLQLSPHPVVHLPHPRDQLLHRPLLLQPPADPVDLVNPPLHLVQRLQPAVLRRPRLPRHPPRQG